MGIEVVPYSPERRAEIAELLNLCLGEKAVSRRDADYWAWKHEQSAFDTSLMLLAVDGNQVVGVRAFMRWRLRCGDQNLLAVKPVDSVTHPDWQRRGIFSRLTLAAIDMARDEGASLIFNTPNNNSLPGYLKLGWTEVARLPLYVKLLRPMTSGFRYLHHRLRPCQAPEPARYFRSQPPSAAELINGRALHPVGAPASEMLVTPRTPEFLRWRYAAHPHIPYYTEQSSHDAAVSAAIVYRLNYRSGLREIMIDDILCSADDWQAHVTDLLANLIRRTSADYLIAHAGDGTRQAAYLRSQGFWRLAAKGPRLAVRPLADRLPIDPLRIENWNLCFGDLEGL